ncbi:uncharacterized protein LOC108835364 [Raphanus sativus]|uniref:Uncharacterized protein LOC108835364 n=1 Tax=Raphanus sativus TaxID=3726 RepID=A0A6J0LVB4_RAPSA|nr:uncharacterized protein LOC108835364 [Raphanus sativus]
MSQDLPKRIFKEGEETQVTQINNNCRIDFIIRKLEEWLPNELREVKKDPHELWFVFARRALRFSLQEFHAVTGLQCNTSISLEEFSDWDDDDGFWSRVLRKKEGITIYNLWIKHKNAVKKWRNADRIRLVYLCITMYVVLARDEKANIPLKYIKVVMDLEKLRRYPWGVAAYDFLCESVVKTRDFLSEKTTSYVFGGFSYALQIWAMEAVPKIGKLCGKKLVKGFKDGPRCVNWMGAAKVSYDEIIHLESIFTNEDVTFPYISWTGNMNVVEDDQFRRAGDVRDDRIIVLKEMICRKYDFGEHIWEYENTPEISLDLNDEAVNVEEAANGEGNGNESDEDFQTPRGSTSDVSSRKGKGKKRFPDRGIEKRKHKVLFSGPKQAPFSEDMKAFMTQLFEANFSGMEQRLQKQMDEKFEQMKAELRDSRKEARVEVELGHLSPSKPSPRKPSPSKPSPRTPSTSQSSLRRSKRGVKKN